MYTELLQLRVLLELFLNRREFILSSGFLSCCDMTLAVEGNTTTNSTLPTKGRIMREMRGQSIALSQRFKRTQKTLNGLELLVVN